MELGEGFYVDEKKEAGSTHKVITHTGRVLMANLNWMLVIYTKLKKKKLPYRMKTKRRHSKM